MLCNMLNQPKAYTARLNDHEFKTLSEFIYFEIGIKMPEAKRIMLEIRLQKRLRDLNMVSFKEYFEFVFSKENKGIELLNMIDVITTNKTDFFREPYHFEYLSNIYLPDLKRNKRSDFLKIWSAGCSSGEEPYTIAMVLNESFEKKLISDFSIFASDISTRILQKAVIAVYPMTKIEEVPLYYKRKYFLKHKDSNNQTVMILPSLRNKIIFERMNFMNPSFSVAKNFDLIFCRNVLIYFDRETQEKVIKKLCSCLKTGGILFLGHSESIINFDVPLSVIKPTIYKKI